MRTKPSSKKTGKKQRGQFVIEALLVMFLFAFAASLISTQLRDRNLLGRLVAGPWERLAGMMGSGHWEPVNSARATGKLPHQRATTREGDD